MRQRLAVPTFFVPLFLSVSALACARGEILINTSPYFIVRVTNDYGPVVGLRVSVMYFRADEYSKATAENRSPLEKTTDAMVDTNEKAPHARSIAARAKAIKIRDYVDVIATSVTDSNGRAQFHLNKSGSFTLEADHPIADLGDIILNVSGDATSAVVDVVWPTTSILETRTAKGNIEDGLYKSTGKPLKQSRVSLHELISYKEVAVTDTTENGSFQLPGVPPGFYFLAVKAKEKGPNPPDGDIALVIRASAPRDSLSIAVAESDCGLSYDLVENKSKYKPVACFRGGVWVRCQY